PRSSGRELQRLGHRPGPRFREILRAVAQARWQGKLKTPSAEIRFIIDNYPPP
ncbi:MAG: CCA tRNA nucleotidyltransferase, partial [Elusimicrobia bacterium]|nr:CCA tRNA nucleotidyltransferase [Elusimicrobiota bacterium]